MQPFKSTFYFKTTKPSVGMTPVSFIRLDDGPVKKGFNGVRLRKNQSLAFCGSPQEAWTKLKEIAENIQANGPYRYHMDRNRTQRKEGNKPLTVRLRCASQNYARCMTRRRKLAKVPKRNRKLSLGQPCSSTLHLAFVPFKKQKNGKPLADWTVKGAGTIVVTNILNEHSAHAPVYVSDKTSRLDPIATRLVTNALGNSNHTAVRQLAWLKLKQLPQYKNMTQQDMANAIRKLKKDEQTALRKSVVAKYSTKCSALEVLAHVVTAEEFGFVAQLKIGVHNVIFAQEIGSTKAEILTTPLADALGSCQCCCRKRQQ